MEQGRRPGCVAALSRRPPTGVAEKETGPVRYRMQGGRDRLFGFAEACILEEAVGFEPTDGFPRRQFSRLIH